MRTISIILLAVFLINFTGCSESETDSNGNTPLSGTKAAIIESNNDFAFNIFNALIENDDPGTNLFISPLSMYYALSMAANGAKGETYNAFKQTLGYNSEMKGMLQDIKSLYEQLIVNDDKLIVEIANSLWTDQSFKVKEKYKTELTDYFYAAAQSLDFGAQESVDIINDWIEDKTHGKIQNMLNAISPDEILFLINAIYFKGDWQYSFNKDDNMQLAFHKEDGASTEVEFMNQRVDISYLKKGTFSAIKLPYTDTNYFMTIFLPSGNKTTDDVLDILNSDSWNRIQSEFVKQEVSLSIPKFKFEYGVREISKELKEMGLSIAFSDYADFSGISDLGLAISRVLHKSYIDVNEKGSEAAAATIVGIELTSMNPEQITFAADHPFIFTISERTTNTILFMGKVSEPDYE
jgi:serpin B